MLGGNQAWAVGFGVLATAFACAAVACAPRPVACTEACAKGVACVSGACLAPGTAPDLEALDKFGAYRARRLVLTPVAAVRLAPGDTEGAAPRVATLGRARDGGSMLLLRFAVDLPPDAAVMGAYVLLDRVSSLDADPAAIALHAARIASPWDVRSIAWGRAPRIEDSHLPATRADGTSGTVRLDVRALVQRWRRHAPDDQGIAVLAEGTTPLGMTFAFADGVAGDLSAPVSVRSPGPPSLYSSAEPGDDGSAVPLRGPRLELYLRP